MRTFLAVGGLLLILTSGKAQAPDTLEFNLQRANMDAKYSMLLAQIKVPDDAKTYGKQQDSGNWPAMDYAGHKGLPAGYWVYVEPYWYIWRDVAANKTEKRNWGTEQLIGEPDTHDTGDITTAWASAEQDSGDEWVLLEYAKPVAPKTIRVYETYNPGALRRVTVFGLDGEEKEVWKGTDPAKPEGNIQIATIPARFDGKIARVKLYLDSKTVPGWNEIDAVSIEDTSGKLHWATAAHASSTYPERYTSPVDPGIHSLLLELETKLREAQAIIDQIKTRSPRLLNLDGFGGAIPSGFPRAFLPSVKDPLPPAPKK